MTSKSRRDRLLKHRPSLRRCDLANLPDIGILWAEYWRGGFYLEPGLDEDDFMAAVRAQLAAWDSLWFMDDRCAQYASGTGPVALVSIRTDGWRVEPHVHHFSWSSARQKLRTVVALLQLLRHDRNIGVVLVIADNKRFFDHVCGYGVLFPKGQLHNGLPTGLGHIYTVKGKRQCLKHSASQAASSASQAA